VEEEVVIDIPNEIQSLAEQRRQAKADKNWTEADRLRKELEEK
jgi:cysteinyl-tRNA synthetase